MDRGSESWLLDGLFEGKSGLLSVAGRGIFYKMSFFSENFV